MNRIETSRTGNVLLIRLTYSSVDGMMGLHLALEAFLVGRGEVERRRAENNTAEIRVTAPSEEQAKAIQELIERSMIEVNRHQFEKDWSKSTDDRPDT